MYEKFSKKSLYVQKIQQKVSMCKKFSLYVKIKFAEMDRETKLVGLPTDFFF